jgi:hypothetical protein
MLCSEQVLDCGQHRDRNSVVTAAPTQRQRGRSGPAGPLTAAGICQGEQRSPVVAGTVIERTG